MQDQVWYSVIVEHCFCSFGTGRCDGLRRIWCKKVFRNISKMLHQIMRSCPLLKSFVKLNKCAMRIAHQTSGHRRTVCTNESTVRVLIKLLRSPYKRRISKELLVSQGSVIRQPFKTNTPSLSFYALSFKFNTH